MAHDAQLNHTHSHKDTDESGLAELLDLDAAIFHSYLDDVIGWAARIAERPPRRVVDLGAGTGTGSLALARRFPAAEVVAIDSSAFMLERLRASAQAQALAARLRGVQADLDAIWPDVGTIDFAWAASSMHHFADPDRVLRDVHAALNPGGAVVIVEMDALPRFLPEAIVRGRPGLEERCHEAMVQAGWNAHPDWRPHLERAGFVGLEQRDFPQAIADPAGAERYARRLLAQFREGLADRLTDDDLGALDRILADDSPDALLRGTLTFRSIRTAWAGRRAPDEDRHEGVSR
ncbi:MAG TPA: class I SAM-dependent methyltransferase [Terrimesophilobacter sp.]|nr:class I SAM-dependent methyltransferase [Terrimesophilobacter sp.]